MFASDKEFSRRTESFSPGYEGPADVVLEHSKRPPLRHSGVVQELDVGRPVPTFEGCALPNIHRGGNLRVFSFGLCVFQETVIVRLRCHMAYSSASLVPLHRPCLFTCTCDSMAHALRPPSLKACFLAKLRWYDTQ